jgi:DNA-binding response OmpR family regulator
MVRGVKLWEAIHSFFGVLIPSPALPSRTPMVALVLIEEDRRVLAGISSQEPFDMHFAKSFDEACALANQLVAPVVLFDRNWPGTDWRTSVERLAALPHHSCVILLSGVADDYLRQELVRQGGYDVLPKPLRSDKVVRVVKLALSYWNSSEHPALPARIMK